MSDRVHTDLPVFGVALDDLTLHWGDWQEPSLYQSLASISYVITLTAPTTLKAYVQLAHRTGAAGTEVIRGLAPVVSSISGADVTIKDAALNLTVDTDPHIFEVLIRAGYAWRVGFIRTGGAADTTITAKAEVISNP